MLCPTVPVRTLPPSYNEQEHRIQNIQIHRNRYLSFRVSGVVREAKTDVT